eukprot:6648179-Prymnesium_polylepis.1
MATVDSDSVPSVHHVTGNCELKRGRLLRGGWRAAAGSLVIFGIRALQMPSVFNCGISRGVFIEFKSRF